MDPECSSDELTTRFDDVEDSMIVLREFVLDKVKNFDERLSKLESRAGDLSVSDQVSDVRSDFEKHFRAEENHSTPKKVCQRVPASLGDLTDSTLRSALETFMPTTLDPKEKLTKVQLAFFHYWLSKHEVKGRREEARQLEKSGMEANVWYKGYVPEGCKSFSEYLYEKLRAVVRKLKRAEKRKELDSDFDLAKEAMLMFAPKQ